MAKLKKRLRRFLPFPKRKTLRRWFPPFETRNLVYLLQLHRIDVVFDVGANRGQYGERLRSAGFKGRIISFEPLSGPHAELKAAAAKDTGWIVPERMAIGAAADTVTINIYEDDSLSSAHALTAEAAREKGRGLVGQEAVPVAPLDDLFDVYVKPGERAFLKIDVQGFEDAVLDGAAASLKKLSGLQVELALSGMYEGEVSFIDMVARIDRAGFRMEYVLPVTNRRRLGPIEQIDGVFFRREA